MSKEEMVDAICDGLGMKPDEAVMFLVDSGSLTESEADELLHG